VAPQSALSYAKAFPEEIENAIRDSQSSDFGKVSRTLPQAEEFVAPVEPKRKK